MRCKACNAENARAYAPPDYYCDKCIEVIYVVRDYDYTYNDLFEAFIESDEEIIDQFLKENTE